jgi:hypothetical protein
MFKKTTQLIFPAQEFDRQEERFNHELERMTEKLQNAQYQVSCSDVYYITFLPMIFLQNKVAPWQEFID